MTGGKANSLSAHSPTRGTCADPLCVGYVPGGKVFSLISSLPSSLSADDAPVFVRFIPAHCNRDVTPTTSKHGGRVAQAFDFARMSNTMAPGHRPPRGARAALSARLRPQPLVA